MTKADMKLIAEMIAGNNQDTTKTSTKPAKAKKRSIYFEKSDYKGKPKMLIYPNGKPADGKFSRFIAIDPDVMLAILNSSDCEDFAS